HGHFVNSSGSSGRVGRANQVSGWIAGRGGARTHPFGGRQRGFGRCCRHQRPSGAGCALPRNSPGDGARLQARGPEHRPPVSACKAIARFAESRKVCWGQCGGWVDERERRAEQFTFDG
ncbi:unnamed protein product, partial [Polarella glacialis]